MKNQISAVDRVFNSEAEFAAFAGEWVKGLGHRDLVLLEGPMGVGKTFFVRKCVEALGGKWVSSPSFAVIQRYPTTTTAIDHVDLFRLKNMADIDSTGFWDLFEQRDALIFVEWADRVQSHQWPLDFKVWKVQIEFSGNSRRFITGGSAL